MSFNRQTILRYNYCYYSILPNAYNFTSQVIYIKASILHEEHFFFTKQGNQEHTFWCKRILDFSVHNCCLKHWPLTNDKLLSYDVWWSTLVFSLFWLVLYFYNGTVRFDSQTPLLLWLHYAPLHTRTRTRTRTHTHITRKYDVIRKTGSA